MNSPMQSFIQSFIRMGSICLLLASASVANAAEGVSFNRDIRPILSAKCFACHGPDSAAREADLRLDRAEGAAHVLQDGGESELLQRILSPDPDLRMPPPDSKLSLSTAERELLQGWVEKGANYEGHWAFQTPVRPKLPTLDEPWATWPANEIDHFIAQQLQLRGLEHAPPAAPRTLARRLALDLTGLPPTLEQVETFAANPTENAYEKLVDELLASPRYGEQMARFWMDAARYADTNGYQYDLEREQWVWRDWVIHAFNENKPFDQFTIEQLAGDLLPDSTDEQRLATGFNRNHSVTIEGGIIDEEYRTEYVVDRVVTTSSVWLGLTMTCSRCHDHKYDPISQREFYQFFAFFNNVPERGMRGFAPQAKIASPLRQSAVQNLQAKVAEARKIVDQQLAAEQADFEQWRQQRLKQVESGWQWADLESMRSTGGATLQRQKDGSVLATGKNPTTDTYVVEIPVASHASAIRLEALTDPSTVNEGAGRGSNGNFVLTEIVAEFMPAAVGDEVKPAGDDSFEKVKFKSASADYSQKDFNVSLAIDGKRDRKGWAVDGHEKIESRTATFALEEPVGRGVLRLQLVHKYGLSHQIARFRFSVWAADQGGEPPQAAELALLGIKSPTAAQRAALRQLLARQFGSAKLQRALAELKRAEQRLEQISAQVPSTMVMSEMPQPRATRVLFRGEYDKPRDVVQAGTPQALPPMPEDNPRNRLGLAKWLVSRQHPLTARVTVNRLWQQLFGRGIVATVEDFGAQGEWPTHPELLDWLAVDFMESGWDVKRLLKRIVMSSTYRQSGQLSKDNGADNRWLSRGPRMRLDAEVIRDSALAAAGLLTDDLGGPSVFPYHPEGLWQEINNRPGYSRTYQQDTGDGLYRRSLYTFWKRTVPPPSMAVFDAPTREFCVVRRSRTNTPLQAFVMLNDPQFLEAARVLAGRALTSKQVAPNDADRLRYIFQSLLTRLPAEAETRVLLELLQRRRERYAGDEAAGERLLKVGETTVPSDLDRTELAAWTAIARTVMNLSEFVTKP